MQINQFIADLRTLLSPEIGKIKPSATSTSSIPAIALEPAPGQGQIIEGILAVIQRVPEGNSIEVTRGKFQDLNIIVRLIQFDRTKSLEPALKLLRESSQYRIRNVVYTPPTSQTYEQARVSIWIPELTIYS